MIRSIRKISSASICELCLRPLSHCEPLLPRGSPKTTERFQARPRRPSGIRAVRVPQAMFGMITLILTITGWWFQPSWNILVNGKDYPIYYGYYGKNVPNHQPALILTIRVPALWGQVWSSAKCPKCQWLVELRCCSPMLPQGWPWP